MSIFFLVFVPLLFMKSSQFSILPSLSYCPTNPSWLGKIFYFLLSLWKYPVSFFYLSLLCLLIWYNTYSIPMFVTTFWFISYIYVILVLLKPIFILFTTSTFKWLLPSLLLSYNNSSRCLFKRKNIYCVSLYFWFLRWFNNKVSDLAFSQCIIETPPHPVKDQVNFILLKVKISFHSSKLGNTGTSSVL